MFNIDNSRHLIQSFFDCIVGVIMVVFSFFCEKQDLPPDFRYMLSCMCLAYFFTRLLMSFFPKWTFYLVLSLSLCSVTYEAFLGILQICGLAHSGHILYACTGSFNNPGPYGGFLSTNMCVLIAYIILSQSRWTKRVISLFLILPIVILPATQSRSALLALTVSMFLLLIRTEWGRRFIQSNLLWITLILMFFGVGLYFMKKQSADGRMFMNRMSIRIMKENGVHGIGLGRYAGHYGETQANYFSSIMNNSDKVLDWNLIDNAERMTADCPDRAYNDIFQLGVTCGWPIMVLFLVLSFFAVLISFRSVTIWCYGVLSIMVFSFFSYPIQLIQFQVLFSILLACCITEDRGQFTSSNVVTLVLGIFSIVFVIRMIPEHKHYVNKLESFRRMQYMYNKEQYEYVAEDGAELMEYMIFDRNFLFEYGRSLNQIGQYEKSDSVLLVGTKISCDPMFWNVMGNNSLARGEYREAEDRYEHAFCIAPNRLYPLYLLAKLYYLEGDIARFNEMAEKVANFIPKVESENTKRLRSEIAELRIGCITEKEK